MMGLNGSIVEASRNGAIASAGRPALRNLVASASKGASWLGATGFAGEDIGYLCRTGLFSLKGGNICAICGVNVSGRFSVRAISV